MKQIKSCGFVIFKSNKYKRFLLLKHTDRLDFPKGHIKRGELEINCALRELKEETGINADEIVIDKDFLYRFKYFPKYKKYENEVVEKTLVIFLAYLKNKKKAIQVTEHIGYKWKKRKPPYKIQTKTINPVMKVVEKHLTHKYEQS